MQADWGPRVEVLTVLLTVVLVSLGGLVGSSAGNQLVRERCLVVLVNAVLVVVVVGAALVRIVCSKRKCQQRDHQRGSHREPHTAEPTHFDRCFVIR